MRKDFAAFLPPTMALSILVHRAVERLWIPHFAYCARLCSGIYAGAWAEGPASLPAQSNALGKERLYLPGLRPNGPTTHRDFGERMARWADLARAHPCPQGVALGWANQRAFGPRIAQFIGIVNPQIPGF